MWIYREYTNIHDRCACLVWIPPLSDFPKVRHDMVTEEKRRLFLKDIVELPVGHVPRGLAECFITNMDLRGVIFC